MQQSNVSPLYILTQHIVNIDDIWKLSKGEPTKEKIGSRGIPHRLTIAERFLVERALKKGYLELKHSNRVNPENIYKKLCAAKKIPLILVRHDQVSSTVEYGGQKKTFDTRKAAKVFAASLV